MRLEISTSDTIIIAISLLFLPIMIGAMNYIILLLMKYPASDRLKSSIQVTIAFWVILLLLILVNIFQVSIKT